MWNCTPSLSWKLFINFSNLCRVIKSGRSGRERNRFWPCKSYFDRETMFLSCLKSYHFFPSSKESLIRYKVPHFCIFFFYNSVSLSFSRRDILSSFSNFLYILSRFRSITQTIFAVASNLSARWGIVKHSPSLPVLSDSANILYIHGQRRDVPRIYYQRFCQQMFSSTMHHVNCLFINLHITWSPFKQWSVIFVLRSAAIHSPSSFMQI